MNNGNKIIGNGNLDKKVKTCKNGKKKVMRKKNYNKKMILNQRSQYFQKMHLSILKYQQKKC